jgi:2-O-(6-phospho-alpha-D-mannosyl)-D-glycerate hydrolase
VEDAPTTFPQQDWVDLSDGKYGLCIINQGLPEYEVRDTEQREITITLLRAVGYLGAGTDLMSAAVGAGPNIPTPEAQIQRSLTFSLSILPHRGTWQSSEVWRQAMRHNNPPRAFTTGMVKNQMGFSNVVLPPKESFLRIDGSNVILSAVKKAEQSEALILRFYNPSDDLTQASILLPFAPTKVELVGLAELPRVAPTEQTNPAIEEKTIHISLAPKKIITLRIERA